MKISMRHHQVALLTALAYAQHEIAQAVGLSSRHIGKVLVDPEVKKLVAHYRDTYFANVSADVEIELKKYAVPAVRRLAELSDQNTDLGVAARAAGMLLDHAHARKSSHQEERTVHIILEKHETDYHRGVLDEARVIGDGSGEPTA